eukprot:scaffold27065_cov150-Skeletonema_menzelii.AAC.8
MMSSARQKPNSMEKNAAASEVRTCHVAVIGSGLGGIAAALAIINMQNEKKQSAITSTKYNITIYERDKSFSDRKEGYGMTLTYDPNGPLQKLGVLEEVAKRDCPSRCHYLFTAEGVIKGYFGNAFYEEEKQLNTRGSGQRGNLRIPRSELRSILWKALQANDVDNNVCISWGKRLIAYVDRAMMDKIEQIGNKQCKKTSSDAHQRPVLLTFDDGTTDEVDLLIGADGVNSVVAKQYLQTALPTARTNNGIDEVVTYTSPALIGIFIILGITDHFHPHIDERGFYTLDGFHRLFIMPFEGSRISSSNRRRTMWQLSFPADANESKRLSNLSQSEMQQEVLNRCKEWHEPFPDMVKNTPLDTVWGTALLDRDPQIFIEHRRELEIHGRIPSRVMLLGDAAHAMSPFKGQGANNALQDGPLLAKWLSTAKLDSAVRGFMTEMSRRGGVKVRASREAAIALHSNDCWESMVKQDKPTKRGYGTAVFHGVESEHVPKFLEELKKRGVTASLASKLDDSIRSIIKELNVAERTVPGKTMDNPISSAENLQLQSESISFASTGDLEQLRRVSRKSYPAIPIAKDSKGRSCLHVAAMNGHLAVCRWLLSEVNISPSILDVDGKSALDLAMAGNHNEIISLLRRWPVNTASANNNVKTDLYRVAEKKLRGIRTMQQLRSMLQNQGNSTITRVLGCTVDRTEEEQDLQCTKSLAEEHGAVIFRNFVPRKVDQLALAALALRPLNLDYSSVADALNKCFAYDAPKKQRKQQRKQIEKIKSQLTIPSDASIICQTNWGPQMESYTQKASEKEESAPKKRKIDSFPLSKLRYLNLGAFNYNWGDRRYDLISGAEVLHSRLVSLAQHATAKAAQTCDKSQRDPAIDFNMAICNFYHLQRPADRLGGHQDNVESNLSLPLVTISLGAPGVFLLGRESREVLPTAILLQAGDCMVLSGKSRGYFHGIPTILEYDDDNDRISHDSEKNVLFPELSDEGLLVDDTGGASSENNRDYVPTQVELKFAEAFLSTVRMNMSIRQV